MSNLLIMLVDDNDTDNFINRRMLEFSGFNGNIIIKQSGISALEYLHDNIYNLRKIPDLLFLDINMPLVDGLAFLYKFDDLPDTIKNKCSIIVLTSSDSPYDIAKFVKDDNVKDYISKPLTTEALNKIKISLSRKNSFPMQGSL